MRVTTQTRLATRERILSVTADLLLAQGWEDVTTRDITAAAGIANGTLFNYFPSKEAIAASIIGEALETAEQEFTCRRSGDESLDEDLFAFEWAALKRLRKYRKFLSHAVAAIFSPLAQPAREDPGAEIRTRHLQAVQKILARQGAPQPLPAVLVQLYWTLHIGAFAFWANDSSPHQEDTLALLDRSLKLFAASLSGPQGVEDERFSE